MLSYEVEGVRVSEENMNVGMCKNKDSARHMAFWIITNIHIM